MRTSVEHGLARLGRDGPATADHCLDRAGRQSRAGLAALARRPCNRPKHAPNRTPSSCLFPAANGGTRSRLLRGRLRSRSVRDCRRGLGSMHLWQLHDAKVVQVEVSDRGAAAWDDLDTPEDYERHGVNRGDVASSPRVTLYNGSGVSVRAMPRRRHAVQVTVRLFAHGRDRAGRPEVTLDVPEPATVGGLKRAMVAGYPAAGPARALHDDCRRGGVRH